MSTEVPAAPAPGSLATFLGELLLEQQRLQTPVARFSALHSHGFANSSKPSLIPLSAPAPGEQYAFEVDLDSCSGCKSCVSACHSLNGLDDAEAWRDVGLVHGGTTSAPYQQTITTACHHCTDPGCLNGCPVVAYEKDPVTGIVRHLDDQCIGCSYCVLKCPYDVPKYNERLGIVRKCDMCQQRLAVGEAPACAQACPTHAIRIVKVSTTSTNDAFLAPAPDPNYTQPTTRYVSRKPLPLNAAAADATTLVVQPAHLPLALMLTLTQLGLGLLATFPSRLTSVLPENPGKRILDYVTLSPAPFQHLAGLALLFGGLGASVLHLGRPLRAWRFFLGLRTSWLSREILVFSFTAPLALASLLWPNSGLVRIALIGTGTSAIACSAMIYIDTRRRFWAPIPTCIRFFGTACVAAAIPHHPFAAAALLAVKIAVELRQQVSPSISGRLLRGPLRITTNLRFALAACAIVSVFVHASLTAFLFFAAGEFIERTTFFLGVDPSKMPGHPANP